MGEFGLKIKNIQAGSLKGYIDGVRSRFDYTDAMFCNSLFYYYIREHGLKDYKDESTRDLICIDFSYGTRTYEQEIKHLQCMLKSEEDEEKKERIKFLIKEAEKNKNKYIGLTKDGIRKDFYVNGVPITYRNTNKKTGKITEEKIRYRMLFRNASKAKTGMANFINEELFEIADDWLTMGLRKKLNPENSRIVELSAYAPLTTSTIVDRFHIPMDEILILDDEESIFHTIADVVKSADYEIERIVVDKEATEIERQKALNNNRVNELGSPIYKPVQKKEKFIEKRCIVVKEETDVTSTVWDGMALIESSFCPGENNGMVLLRNHFFKACAFKSHIQLFLKDYCDSHNIDYETYTIKDIFGREVLAKNIKLVTNKDACKWWKFIDIMGGTKEKAYNYWRERVEADGSIWGIVKQDHPSKLGENHEIQQLSYQAINTLPISKEDFGKVIQGSIDYVELLKRDNNEFAKFLKANANEANHFDMLADLYDHNHEFEKSKMWKTDKASIINRYVAKLRKGKITVEGDNLTICGNPYALLLYMVGEDWENDPTLNQEKDCIQVYTTRFKDGEYLCGFRSPHNAMSNTGYFKNNRHPLMEKYMDFSPNIMAVNCIKTDIQSRLNGADFDADSVLVTNQPEMVEAARISYRDYPTAVNAIGQSNKTYKNEWSEYAKMDSAANQAQMGIGLSSNLAQLCLSYYWTKVAKNEYDEELIELYHNCVILATLAQILIDGIKRSFEVDALLEVDRIQSLPCMQKYVEVVKNGKIKKIRKDLPYFMKYVKEVPTTKNGNDLPSSEIKKSKDKINNRIDESFICPMNWLQEYLNKIQGSSRSNIIPTKEFFIYMSGKADNAQIGKIRKIINDFDNWVKVHSNKLNSNEEEYVNELIYKTKEVEEQIRNYRISNITMNRLISSVLGIDLGVRSDRKYKEASKYTRKMLNQMYKYNREQFLKNFK